LVCYTKNAVFELDKIVKALTQKYGTAFTK